jgi:outer membrane lipoprotein carrier protein
VKVLAAVVSLFAVGAFGADVDLSRVLKTIETRYNTVKTIEMDFEQTYIAPNKARRTESGRLFLRKPGRMRWEYTKPDGKLFVSNGSDYWYYSPMARRAEKMKLKEAEDMQAPMAFLIGKLDFQRDFDRYVVKQEGALVRITAQPRNPEKAPYREVSFLAAPDSRIEQLTVRGQDASTMEFRFSNETRNPVQKDSLYIFTPPEGVEVVTPGKEQ